MRSLPESYTMLIFKRVLHSSVRIRNFGTSSYLNYTLHNITFRANFPNCVQSGYYNSNQSLNLAPLINFFQGSVQRCYSTTATAQHGLEPEKSVNENSLPEMSELTFVENDPDSSGEVIIEKHLEEKRRIWNVGPAYRPSFNLAPFVNESIVLKNFVKMGVQLHRWDKQRPSLIEHILKLDFDKDVAPCIRFLVDNGIPPSRLHHHFSENPAILQENIKNLEIRVEYLRSKDFEKDAIIRIIDTYPKWLSLSVGYIDSQLGLFQTKFRLTGSQVRKLAVSTPSVITLPFAQVEKVTFTIMEEMGFSPNEVVELLLSHPAIWRINPLGLWGRFDYLHNTLKFSHETILKSSKLLMTRESKLRNRIGYLQKCARAQFDPKEPNYVSMDDIINGTDAEFAENVCKTSVVEYNAYLKTV